MRRWWVMVCCVLGVATPASAELLAERITEANFATFAIGGPDAIGGVGDWYLANERVEIVVDDPSRRFAKLNHGGTIVAAGVRGRPGDGQFARMFPIVNMDQRVLLNYDRIRTEREADGSAARIVVWSEAGMSAIERDAFIEPLVPTTEEIAEVHAETVYEVRPGEPFVRITTRLVNRGNDDAPIFAFGEVWMRGGRGPHGFVGNTLDPEASSGFHHRNFDRSRPLTALTAITPFTFVAVNGVPPWPPITYALASPERVAKGLRMFAVTGTHVHLMNTFFADDGWQDAPFLKVAGALGAAIPAGEERVHTRRLLITEGGDVASATDLLFPMLGHADGDGGVRGSVEPASQRVVIHVETGSGAPVTQIEVRPEGPSPGRYEAVLPPGEYRLRVRAPHRPEREVALRVASGAFTEAPLQRYEPLARLRFAPAFLDEGAGRVLVRGAGDTPDPRFHAELVDFRLDGKAVKSAIETDELHFVDGDPREVEIAPGRYRLIATRGLEYDVEERVIDVPAGDAATLIAPFDLERIIALDGQVVADFHVHGEASDDSGMSNEARLASFAAEHVDVLVSTDHDVVGNYDAALEAMGLRDRLRVIGGLEVTGAAPSHAAPYTTGHHNAWPIAYRESAHRKGAVPNLGLTLAEIYATLRSDHGARVLQLNHALPPEGEDDDTAGNYWMHLGDRGEPFDATLPLDQEPNAALLEPASDGTRAIDFDAMEVMNGVRYSQYLRLRDAWYALLLQGYRRTATGNSDTHAPAEIAAYPRSYVATDDRLGGAAFDAAVRAGRVFFTTGPLLAGFRANGGFSGDTVPARDGKVKVDIAVVAVPWVPVEEVRLLVNGAVVKTLRDLAPPDEVLRYEGTIELRIPKDAFLTLEAGAPLDAEPQAWSAAHAGAYTRIVPGAISAALANPIYVDADGDGEWHAPGLASTSRAAERLPWVAMLVLVLAVIWWRLRERLAAPSRS